MQSCGQRCGEMVNFPNNWPTLELSKKLCQYPISKLASLKTNYKKVYKHAWQHVIFEVPRQKNNDIVHVSWPVLLLRAWPIRIYKRKNTTCYFFSNLYWRENMLQTRKWQKKVSYIKSSYFFFAKIRIRIYLFLHFW